MAFMKTENMPFWVRTPKVSITQQLTVDGVVVNVEGFVVNVFSGHRRSAMPTVPSGFAIGAALQLQVQPDGDGADVDGGVSAFFQ